MSSNRQLLEAGTAKRADLVKVLLEELHLEPDFNAPESAEEFDAHKPATVAGLIFGRHMNPANALSQLSPGMAECHARLMAVAKHGTTEEFSATLAGVLQRAELSISNAYDAGAQSIQVEAVAAPAAANEITKAFREYLTVHPNIKLGGHEADTVARELALIAQPAVAAGWVKPPGQLPEPGKPVALRWWCFDQNNSGGYLITNDTVAEYVFIQARNAKEAVAKAEAVFVDHSEYCDCCGERWSYYVGEDDGKQTPEIYGTRIENVRPGIFPKEARLHHFDGHIQAYKLGEPIPGLLIDKFAPPTNPAGSGKGE